MIQGSNFVKQNQSITLDPNQSLYLRPDEQSFVI